MSSTHRVVAAIAALLPFTCIATAQGITDPQAPRAGHPSADYPIAQDSETGDPRGIATHGTRLEPRITRIHTAPDDMGVPYGTWAAGAGYKASFHDGMTFVPYLGRDYPHNQPWSWTTRSVAIGEVELTTEPASHRHTDTRYEYDLGGVTEAYDVRLDGLEQTFVIRSRPNATGDLTVVGDITSALAAEPTAPAHGPLVFHDERAEPVLSYGAATAIDAAGRSTPMSTSYSGGRITLTLDGTWLQSATFPVVVDPLIGNVAMRFGTPAFDVDVVRDDVGTSDNVWYIYSRSASATDTDLWLWRRDDDLQSTDVGAFMDTTTSWSTDGGKLAVSAATGKVVAVFSRHWPSLVPEARRLRWHAHDMSDLTSDTTYGALVVQSSSGVNDWRPAIGGTRSFSSGREVCIVWQREENGAGNGFSNSGSSAIYGMILDMSASQHGAAGTPFPIREYPTHDAERPSINRASRGAGTYRWAVAYMLWDGNPLDRDWDIYLKHVDNTGATFGSANLEPSAQNHKLGPTIDGQDGRYLVVYATVPTATVNNKTDTIQGHEVKSARVDTVNSTFTVLGTRFLISNSDRRWTPGGCAYDTDSASHWAVTYHSNITNNSYITRLGYTGALLRQHTLYDGTATDDPFVGALSFDDDNDRFVSVFPVANLNAFSPVYGDLLTYPTAPPWTQTGTTCWTANINWRSAGSLDLQDQQIGNEFTEIFVGGAPQNAVHFLMMSLAPKNTPVTIPVVASGCRLLVEDTGPAYLGVFPIRIGNLVSWQLPLPEFLPAMTLYFQDWHTDSSASTMYSTRRLTVPLVR